MYKTKEVCVDVDIELDDFSNDELIKEMKNRCIELNLKNLLMLYEKI